METSSINWDIKVSSDAADYISLMAGIVGHCFRLPLVDSIEAASVASLRAGLWDL